MRGLGKSISMAILRFLPAMKNPTIVVQVDRAALDQQLFENFVLAKDLVGEVHHADDTESLRKLLSTDGGGVVFTMIEKFRLKNTDGEKKLIHPVLLERYDLIVMAEKGYRTQYGFKDGGFSQNTRKVLLNTSFIGFTGKLLIRNKFLEKPYLLIYIEQAVKGSVTVCIDYVPLMVPLNIKGRYSQDSEELEEEAGETNAVWGAIEDTAGVADTKEILDQYKNELSPWIVKR